MKYLKTWMGVTSGSYLGRDDGYPERKFALVESLDDLVKTFDPEAEYFRLEPVDVRTVMQATCQHEPVISYGLAGGKKIAPEDDPLLANPICRRCGVRLTPPVSKEK